MKPYEIKTEYSDKDILYIVYNNRSINNVLSNFIPKYNPYELLKLGKIELDVKLFQSIYNKNREIEIELSDIDTNAPDYYVTPNDIRERTKLILDAHNNLNETDYKYLVNRGFTDDIIKKAKFGSISHIKDINSCNILGITTHPIMRNILSDGLEGGGIIIPLFDQNGDLVNAAFRKLSDLNKFKYTHTTMDIFMWGLDEVKTNDIVWIVEGVFDKYALDTVLPKGHKSLSISSASMSPIQFMSLINKKPKKVNIICDNDQVGFRTGAIAQKVFFSNRVQCDTYYFNSSKDVSEHILTKRGSLDDLVLTRINPNMIDNQVDDHKHRLNMNFFNYLKNRQF